MVLNKLFDCLPVQFAWFLHIRCVRQICLNIIATDNSRSRNAANCTWYRKYWHLAIVSLSLPVFFIHLYAKYFLRQSKWCSITFPRI